MAKKKNPGQPEFFDKADVKENPPETLPIQSFPKASG